MVTGLSDQFISTELITFKQAATFLEAVKRKASELGLSSLANTFHDLYHCQNTIYLHDSEIPNQKDISILLSCPVVDAGQRLTGVLYKDFPFQKWSEELQRPLSYRWEQKSSLIAFERGVFPHIRSITIPEEHITTACMPYSDALLCRAPLSNQRHSCAVALAFGSTTNCTLLNFSGRFQAQWVSDTLFTFNDKAQSIYSECPGETPRTVQAIGLTIWPHYDSCLLIVDNQYFYPRAQSGHLLFTMEAGALRLADPPPPKFPLPSPPVDPLANTEEIVYEKLQEKLQKDLQGLNSSILPKVDPDPVPVPPLDTFPHSSILNLSFSGFAVVATIFLIILYVVAVWRRGRRRPPANPVVAFHAHNDEGHQVVIQQDAEEEAQPQV